MAHTDCSNPCFPYQFALANGMNAPASYWTCNSPYYYPFGGLLYPYSYYPWCNPCCGPSVL